MTFSRILSPPQRRVVELVAQSFSVTVEQVLSRSRSRSIARARQASCYVLRERFGMSLHEIGSLLDRDHTTVLHSIHRSAELMKTNVQFRIATETALQRTRTGWTP